MSFQQQKLNIIMGMYCHKKAFLNKKQHGKR